MGKTRITAEPGIPQIIISREFDAPRDLVFRAYTDPELLVQWLGPRDLTMAVEAYDVRDGGKWRYVSTDAEGNEYGFHGVFHGAPSPDGIVQTFEFEGTAGHVSLDTYTFEERGGRTLVRSVPLYTGPAPGHRQIGVIPEETGAFTRSDHRGLAQGCHQDRRSRYR